MLLKGPLAVLISFTMVLLPSSVLAQGAVPMDPDRAEDSYAIYSQIIPVDEFKSWGAEHNQLWLIKDTTVSQENSSADIEKCLHAPPEDTSAFEQVLSDFKQHSNERVSLKREFHLERPYLLLDEQGEKDYWMSKEKDAATQHADLVKKFKGAPGIISVSEVYFNFDKTLAAVWIWGMCGSLCGQGYWVALKKIDGHWVKQNWSSCMVMS